MVRGPRALHPLTGTAAAVGGGGEGQPAHAAAVGAVVKRVRCKQQSLSRCFIHFYNLSELQE